MTIVTPSHWHIASRPFISKRRQWRPLGDNSYDSTGTTIATPLDLSVSYEWSPVPSQTVVTTRRVASDPEWWHVSANLIFVTVQYWKYNECSLLDVWICYIQLNFQKFTYGLWLSFRNVLASKYCTIQITIQLQSQFQYYYQLSGIFGPIKPGPASISCLSVIRIEALSSHSEQYRLNKMRWYFCLQMSAKVF